MDRHEWKILYIARLVQYGFEKEEAEDNFKAGESSFDFFDDPVDVADAELDYWNQDS